MEKYNYKPSDIEWLGEVPEHWKVKYVKRFASLIYGDNLPQEKRIEGKVDVYGSNGVVDSNINSNTEGQTIIIGRKGSAGALKFSKESCFVIDTAFYVDKNSSTCNLKWLYYALQTLNLTELDKDSPVPGLGRDQVLYKLVFQPPLPEQKAIAEHLDKATAKIDRIIAIKQEQLAKMEGVFNTKLDEVFDDLYQNCEVIRKMKIVVNTTKGYAFKSSLYEDNGHPIIKASDIKGGEINEASTFMTNENATQFSQVALKEKDIIISTVGSQARVKNSAVGQLAYVTKQFEGALLNQNTVILRINSYFTVSTRFLYFQLKTSKYREHLDQYARGTANQASLMLVDILKYKICIPSIEKQNETVELLDRFNSKAFGTIDKLKSQIDTLQAYRKSLIHECVTGKKQVAEIHQPNQKAVKL